MAKKAKAKKTKVKTKASKKTAAKKPVKKTAKKVMKVKKKVAKPTAKKTAAKKTLNKKKPSKTTKKVKVAKATKVIKTAKPVATTAKLVKNWQKYLSPLYDRVLIEKIKQEVVTKSGLYLGEEASSTTYAKAKVLAVGKGLVTKKGSLQPLDVKEGDVIFLSAYSGSNIKVENQELTIVREEEILGIME